jgi:cystathionine beta-lyase/cystathionine gamma-synthase
MGGRAQPEAGEQVDLAYSRFNHPNAEILEDQVVPLEKDAKAAVVFNSGMAAIMTSILTVASPGDAMIYTVPLYGGTQHLIHEFLEPFGIRCTRVLAGDGAGLDEAIRNTEKLRIILIETPANPTLTMTEIRRAAETAASLPAKPVLMVDNTFLGPTFQHPLSLGADMVLYSGTKYLSGFSDLLAGVALLKDTAYLAKMRLRRGLFGNILQPDECWMLDGRLPTVSLRMNRASKNAQRLAERLVSHPKIGSVHYPTLFTDAEQIRIRLSQCVFPGGIFSIDLRGGKAAAFDFLRNLRIARNAVSLGGVETLVCHPKTTTHSSWSARELEEAGITDGMVRVSVGIEDWRDLLEDFEQALAAI